MAWPKPLLSWPDNPHQLTQQAESILVALLKAEVAEREVRSINYQMKVAKFPAYRDLTGFEFTQSQVNEALVRGLHRCEFLEEAQNVVLIGGPVITSPVRVVSKNAGSSLST